MPRTHWDYSAQNVTYSASGHEPLPLSCTMTRIDADGSGTARRAAAHRASSCAMRAKSAWSIEQQANRELIRNLAHEIKNPLGGLRGSAQLLERELDKPRAARIHAGDHQGSRPPAAR